MGYDFYRYASIINRIPGPSYAESQKIRVDRIKALNEFSQQYGSIFRVWMGPRVFVVTSDPENARILLTQSRQFENFERVALGLLMGNGLVVSRGELWKHQRKVMTPVFSVANLRKMIDDMNALTHELEVKWNRLIDEGNGSFTTDICHDLANVTLDIIGKCAFGMDLDFTNQSPDAKHFRDVFTQFGSSIGQSSFINPFFLELVPKPLRFLIYIPRIAKASANLDKLCLQVAQERRANPNGDHKDLLGLLVFAKSDDDQYMPDAQICDEMRTFLLAGHETTATTLGWILHEISQNPKVEAELISEFEKFDSHDLDYDEINQMKYTSMVINETMRYFQVEFQLEIFKLKLQVENVDSTQQFPLWEE
eukprot:TRINITY_DN3244_c2_g1_i1.p1 TRINITY_DN3244_c2_g1~~TRINITY_DN3244_c2_g1_i1.p1  ORF type:complete len:389 (-),score=112.14 TRINITY_DN3244_c2_g1_i1:337-1434(-)